MLFHHLDQTNQGYIYVPRWPEAKYCVYVNDHVFSCWGLMEAAPSSGSSPAEFNGLTRSRRFGNRFCFLHRDNRVLRGNLWSALTPDAGREVLDSRYKPSADLAINPRHEYRSRICDAFGRGKRAALPQQFSIKS